MKWRSAMHNEMQRHYFVPKGPSSQGSGFSSGMYACIVVRGEAECRRVGAWSWNSTTLATRCRDLTHWKRPWCWERLRAGGKGDETGWDGWMASPTQLTWVWVNSRSWWWTGRPGVLQSVGLQRVRHDWATELNWTVRKCLQLLYHLLNFSIDHHVVSFHISFNGLYLQLYFV